MHASTRARRASSIVIVAASFAAILASSAYAGGDTATYRLTVDNTWSEVTHPGAFPPDAHFSWIGGGTHTDAVSFWSVGALASPGIVLMAETGLTTELLDEVEDAIDVGTAGAAYNWPWWFCPDGIGHPNCDEKIVEFQIGADFPLVTFVTMLGPSPDWFVGVDGLALYEGGAFLDEVAVDLRPYDGGTRSANVFQLFGPETSPPDPVTLITEESGQIITPASLGTFTFTRIDAACVADLDQDGVIGFTDVLTVLGAWGACAGCDADLDGDGLVGFTDLLTVLGAWGACGA